MPEFEIVPYNKKEDKKMVWLAIFLGVVTVVLLFIRQSIKVVGDDYDAREDRSTRMGLGWAGVICGAFTALFFILSLLTAVPAGHVGVPVIFGKVQGHYLSEGLNTKNPFARVIKLSVRTETYTMSAVTEEGEIKREDAIAALSSDALRMPLDITVAYKLVASDAPWVYQNLGPDYVVKIVRPASRTAVREATSKFTSQEAYATKREGLAQKMAELLTSRISDLLSQYEDFRGVGFETQQVMLRNVDLPGKVKEAIERKLEAEQAALEMDFVLEKERKEAQRKEIEAGGIKKFQQIVSEGISEPLLRWKGIEATRELAQSDNTTIVVIGSGTKDGMPIILNPPMK